MVQEVFDFSANGWGTGNQILVGVYTVIVSPLRNKNLYKSLKAQKQIDCHACDCMYLNMYM